MNEKMKPIRPFKISGKEVRLFDQEGVLWLSVGDLGVALGYSKSYTSSVGKATSHENFDTAPCKNTSVGMKVVNRKGLHEMFGCGFSKISDSDKKAVEQYVASIELEIEKEIPKVAPMSLKFDGKDIRFTACDDKIWLIARDVLQYFGASTCNSASTYVKNELLPNEYCKKRLQKSRSKEAYFVTTLGALKLLDKVKKDDSLYLRKWIGETFLQKSIPEIMELAEGKTAPLKEESKPEPESNSEISVPEVDDSMGGLVEDDVACDSKPEPLPEPNTDAPATNSVKIFENPEFGSVRTVEKDGEVWFVAKDVSACLGFTNPRDAVATHVFPEDKGVDSIDTLGGRQKVNIINESGLYALVFGSRLKSASQFKHWVTSEILPSIRKTGGYVANDDAFIQNYLPFADDSTKAMFRATLETVRQQNSLISSQKKRIDEMKPKEDFYDAVADSKGAITMDKAAKALEYGRNRLFRFLRDKKVLLPNNMPYQIYINNGMFRVVERNVEIKGAQVPVMQTLVYQKGLDYIRKLLKESGEIE